MEKNDEEHDARPTPDDFYRYVPWACHQFQLNANVYINKIFQNEYVSLAVSDRAKKVKSRAKLTSRHDVGSDQDKDDKSESGYSPLVPDPKTVRISAIYDAFDNLVEIKFEKNQHIPILVLKIIGLIIQFHIYITKISIHCCIDMYILYEITKFLTASNITEICLDGSSLRGGNYDILLQSTGNLHHLSLSRCRIDDDLIKNITNELTFPSPASMTLYILNLSSNKITDVGAKYLADALRTNRQLCYLNIADNRLTDTGVGKILDCLKEFPLSCDELIGARSRHMMYLKEKNVLIDRMVKELKAGEFDKKVIRRKSIKPPTATLKKNKLEKELSLRSMGDVKSLVNVDYLHYDRAVNMVEDTLGEFNDPFSSTNTVSKDGVVYCKGCNTLCYLNVAYNNLTYLSLKKFLRVLIFQKLLDRKPRGLINLCIEGNYMPVACKELDQIDDILEMGLMAHYRRLSVTKKKPQAKNTPR